MRRLNVLLALVFVIAALGAGYMIGRSSAHPGRASHEALAAPAGAEQVWTCSMHPQVRLDRPGKCPICGMPLIPADAAASGPGGEAMLQLSDHARDMASVETFAVERREVFHELHAVGKVEFDETSLATITARVDGYAERLFVNFTGVEVRAGDPLAEVYSPELLVTQKELLIALQSGVGGPDGTLAQAAQLKLLRLGLTEAQIRELGENKELADRVTLLSPIAGTVIEKAIVQSSAFRTGDVLYRIANLDTVWVDLDVYEFDLAWVRSGQKVAISAEALPGRAFAGLVSFVQPIVNEATRTIRVRMQVENADHALKPGMFVSAAIQAALEKEAGAAPSASQNETTYICPMDCEKGKTYPAPGTCPVCGMELVVVPAAEASSGSGWLVVPVSAVLDSGTRRIVYVEKSRGLFEPREVVTGPRAGGFFPIYQGLTEGERVVTRGGFLIDSQFQITGHPSLFYPDGLASPSPPAAAGEHKH